MSHTKVKTIYESEGAYASTDKCILYCNHNHSCDCTTFYEENGEVASLVFCDWTTGKDKWDAVQKLWYPYKDKWGGELKEGVEYYFGEPWKDAPAESA